MAQRRLKIGRGALVGKRGNNDNELNVVPERLPQRVGLEGYRR